MNEKRTIYCKIKAIQAGFYTNIVVEDLTREWTDPYKFITVVRCPNWECPESINIDDVGYLCYQPVREGEQWYNSQTKEFDVYKYTNMYFMNFIRETDVSYVKEFKF